MIADNNEMMEKACVAMCESLDNDPDRWRIGTYTLVDTKTDIEYWLPASYRITQTWNGHSRDDVFSVAQGERIGNSLIKMRRYKANISQEKVLNAFKPMDEDFGLFHRFLLWLRNIA